MARFAIVLSYIESCGTRTQWRLGINQRDRAVFHLGRGITLGVDVGDFLELERAFQGDGKV